MNLLYNEPSPELIATFTYLYSLFLFHVFLQGAFLIPYLIMLVLCGMPMFYMELAVGQYFSLGPIGTWGAICPLFQGKNEAFLRGR